MADPMVDDVGATLPLELYVVTFEDSYYSSNQGTSILSSSPNNAPIARQDGRSLNKSRLRSSGLRLFGTRTSSASLPSS